MSELADLSPWLWIVAPVVIVVGYTVFGLSGFGATIIAVPVLAHFLPVSYLVPMMALLDCGSAAFVGRTSREHLSKDELKRITPFMLIGFVVGATLLVKVADQYLRLALGLFAIGVGVYSILNPVVVRTISKLWCIPIGIAGGAMSTVFGAGGPVYAVYLTARLHDKSRIRTTLSTLISISAVTRVIVYVVGGLINLSIVAGSIAVAPFAFIGVKLGTRIHLGLSQEQMRRAVGAVIVLTGASLVVHALL